MMDDPSWLNAAARGWRPLKLPRIVKSDTDADSCHLGHPFTNRKLAHPLIVNTQEPDKAAKPV